MKPRTLRALAALALLASACGGGAPDPVAKPAAVLVKPSAPSVRVRMKPVARGLFDEPLRWTGFVLSDSKVRIGAEIPGRVAKRSVDRGSAVKKNQVLLRLNGRKMQLALNAARIQRQTAEHALANATRELDRGKALGTSLTGATLDNLAHQHQMARDSVALAKASEASAARTLTDMTIRAPFAGVIAERYVDVGDMVVPGAPLFSLVSVDPMIVRVGVTAASTAQLSPGLRAEVVVTDLGGMKTTGTLRHVARLPDPKTGTYSIDFEVPNAEDRLREGMAAEVVVEPEKSEALLLPREALVDIDGSPAVYIVDDSGPRPIARLKRLRLGRSSATRAEVIDGLAEGDRVVISGQFALSDGMNVSVEAN